MPIYVVDHGYIVGIQCVRSWSPLSSYWSLAWINHTLFHFGFIRLAIVIQEDCQYKFWNQGLDLNVIGGQSEVFFLLLCSNHHMIFTFTFTFTWLCCQAWVHRRCDQCESSRSPKKFILTVGSNRTLFHLVSNCELRRLSFQVSKSKFRFECYRRSKWRCSFSLCSNHHMINFCHNLCQSQVRIQCMCSRSFV